MHAPLAAAPRTFDEALLCCPWDDAALAETDPERVREIATELVEGFRTLADLGPAVSIFGASRVQPGEPMYELARRTAHSLGEAGYAIITGGGPGIMEAANRGARTGGRGCLGGMQHRASRRAGRQPLRRRGDRVPSLLRAQGHARALPRSPRRRPCSPRPARDRATRTGGPPGRASTGHETSLSLT